MFTLYEDEGGNYNYENGKFSEITFSRNESSHQLTIAPRKGIYKGMLTSRKFNIVLVGKDSGAGNKPMKATKTIEYNGKSAIVVAL